jgi:hypothetical protein
MVDKNRAVRHPGEHAGISQRDGPNRSVVSNDREHNFGPMGGLSRRGGPAGGWELSNETISDFASAIEDDDVVPRINQVPSHWVPHDS